jgi:alkyl sulfatase BDS1-like metallo-beta-lactamase superfamily hydrolase
MTDAQTKPATESTAAAQRAVRERLPFADRQDFADAQRGFLGAHETGIVHDAEGRVVWDNASFSFLEGEAPDTVNPSLWRQSQLNAMQGLFEVVPGLYQVRGLDLSVVSFIEGERGVIVVDPLISAETSRAALELYARHRGERPVTGVLYTHSHVDHFGGVRGVVDEAAVAAGEVPIIAPEGLVEHAVSENVYAGVAMSRRAGYMYGAALPRGPRGNVGAGLGQTTSAGTVTLLVPTVEIARTGQTLTVDGVEFVFQLAPGSEAPAEFHFFLPQLGALCMAENATHVLHNILTIRGAQVRDPRAWSQYLREAIALFGDRTEVVFASHHWPTWGRERALRFLEEQADLYAYLHDQTLRLMNRGFTGIEIAEGFELPPVLENAWHARGYYGSVSHNVKAVYQRYMGWYDGNPTSLWKLPPEDAGRRYVEFMGGADAVVERARASFEAGEYRWVAEVLGHVVFAEPGHAAARELLADALEQLGYAAENGTWRCAYLSGAYELRHGGFGTPAQSASSDLFAQLTPEQLFDAVAIRVNGPRSWNDRLEIGVEFTDLGLAHRLVLRNGVLHHRAVDPASVADGADATVRATRPALMHAFSGPAAGAVEGVEVEGDPSALQRLFASLDAPDPDFAIVTPA